MSDLDAKASKRDVMVWACIVLVAVMTPSWQAFVLAILALVLNIARPSDSTAGGGESK